MVFKCRGKSQCRIWWVGRGLRIGRAVSGPGISHVDGPVGRHLAEMCECPCDVPDDVP